MEEPNHSEHPDANGNEVTNSVFGLGSATTWDQLYAALREREQILLSEEANEFLGIIFERGEQAGLKKETVAYYTQLRDLLHRCREVGIDAAMEEFEMPLIFTEADSQAVAQAYLDFSGACLSKLFLYGAREGNAVRAVLEREQALLLTDTAEAVLEYLSKRVEEDQEKDTSAREQYRTLFRRARQIGIDRAWREHIQVTQGKNWTWVKLLEMFEEWVYESILGEGYGVDKPRWGSAIYEGYRQGRRFLEAHSELLDPDFLEGPLNTEIAEIEEYVGSYDEELSKGRFLPPDPQSDLAELPVYRNSRMRVFGLLEGQSLLYDVYARVGTSQAIHDSYVNAYGGFALNLSPWIEDLLKQLETLQQSGEDRQTAAARASLLRPALIRANEDPNVAPEIVVELGRRLLKAFVDDPDADSEAIWQLQIESYTEVFLKVYTRERYPYQWALLQAELGEVYAQRAERGYTNDIEQVIKYNEAALQVITRKTSHKSWDLMENNKTWALLQFQLGNVYAARTSGDRRANLAHAAECHKAALLVYTPEVNLYAHRDIQLALALLYSQEWAAEANQRGDISGVHEAYCLAHEAFVVARQAHLELGWREYYLQDRIKDVVKWPQVRLMYADNAWCLWQLGDLRTAVATLEEGRAQALAQTQAIAGTVLDGVCEYHVHEFVEIRQDWNKQLAQGTTDSISRAREDFLLLRDVIREHCKQDFLPGQPTYYDIAHAAPDHALVYITAMEQEGVAFVVPPAQADADADSRAPIAIALPKLTLRQVGDWLLRRDEERQHVVGGYYFALQRQGAELLARWVYSIDDKQEQEQHLATLVGDLPTAISAPFVTLRTAMSNVVDTWRAEADSLSGQTDAASQSKVHELHTRLALSLKEALEKNIFVPDLNWFLQEAELEQLQQGLSETFIVHLRRELDRLGLDNPDQPIALIPCGQLGMLPLHAAWARSDPHTGDPIPLQETCELTYQASARSLASARAALERLPKRGPIVAIGNPQPIKEVKLEWAEAEAKTIFALAQRYKREGSQIITGVAATYDKVRTTIAVLCKESSGAWVQIASHGHANPTDPTDCYVVLSNDEKLTLADLQRQRLLDGLRGFNASGCVTAVGDLEHAPDELSSFAAGVLQAGSPCAVATLWSVSDKATFLVMLRFMQEWLRDPTLTPARALREAAHWLRTATREQLGDLSKKGLKGIRGLSVDDTTTRDALRGIPVPAAEQVDSVADDALRSSMSEIFKKLLARGGHAPAQVDAPYRHAIYWAAPVIYGV